MRCLVVLAWDGTDWHGAAEVAGLPTIGGALREALGRVGVVEPSIDPWSRTDAGVHAQAGVFLVDHLPSRPLRAWWGALVHHLPDTVRPVRVGLVDQLPRVLHKTYSYTLDASAAGDPWWARRAWRVRVPYEGLVAAAEVVRGPVDFGPFRRRDETRHDLRRVVQGCGWSRSGDRWTCTITADGFPMRGARSLVGAMVQVARGHGTPELLAEVLRGRSHPIARQQAPARGLCLERVTLDPEPVWFSEGDV